MPPGAAESVETGPSGVNSPHRWRRGLRWSGATALLVIAALLVSLAVLARFAQGELLDDDRYLATVEPLATDPAVQDAVANRLTEVIVDQIDIPALTQQLMEAIDRPRLELLAGALSGPVSEWVERTVRTELTKFVHSERFVTLWVEINRAAHQALRAVLTGTDSTLVSTQGDEIVVDLGPVLAAVKQRLVDRGFSLVAKIPDVAIPFTVLSDERLPKMQRYVRWLDTTATWLPLVALALLALGAWCAPNRRRALLIGCVLVAVPLLLLLLSISMVRNQVLDQVAINGGSVPAATAVFDQLVVFLRTALTTVLVFAALGALWLYLAGPGRAPHTFRTLANRGIDRVAEALGGVGLPATVAPTARRLRPWLVAAIALLAAVTLLISPTIGTAIWVVLLAALALALLALATRLPSQPAADPVTAASA